MPRTVRSMSAAAFDFDLFGTPAPDAAQSQWMTPPWLARKVVHWVQQGVRVLEPSCGSGNLLDALFRARHRPENVLAIERDHRWADYTYQRFGEHVDILIGDFLEDERTRSACASFRPDVVLMNPPFEANAHMRFVLRALEIAPVVVGVFPMSISFSRERDQRLWSQHGRVMRRALLPDRVQYGGDQSPSFDSVALKIGARAVPRRSNELHFVTEEVWADVPEGEA